MRKFIHYFLAIFFFISFFYKEGFSQYQNFYHAYSVSNNWYQDSKFPHTSLQPIYSTDTVINEKSERKYWFMRKLLDEEMIVRKSGSSKLVFNFLPDVIVGNSNNNIMWNNTRGFQFYGNVNTNFTFDFQLYETQARFPKYIDTLNIQRRSVIGQGWYEPTNVVGDVYDYTYAFAHIAYHYGNFNFRLANDKLFIGDGYRSLILSDVSIPYPHFLASYESKRFQYSSIYMQHIDPIAPKLSAELGFRKKWAVMHYVNVNIGEKWSLGLFDAVVWQDDDTVGKRGFEMSYANPIIFLRTAEYNTSSSDNALIGLNLKYQLNSNNKIYSQFVLDELKIDEYIKNNGWWANKFAFQLGVRSANIFKIENLNGFTEINLVKPYMYTHKNTLRSYTNYSDALSHPLGANFIENVSRIEYKHGRWQEFFQVNYSQFGSDSITGTNVGKDILASYETRDKEYGNKLLQGIPSSLLFVDARIAYMLNPKINLRIELGYIYRIESIGTSSDKTNILSIGLRSSFRNLYFDR